VGNLVGDIADMLDILPVDFGEAGELVFVISILELCKSVALGGAAEFESSLANILACKLGSHCSVVDFAFELVS